MPCHITYALDSRENCEYFKYQCTSIHICLVKTIFLYMYVLRMLRSNKNSQNRNIIGDELKANGQ